MLKFLILVLGFFITDKLWGIVFSRVYGNACKHDCSKCAMWSCTYGTKHQGYIIPPYDDFSNVCGKFSKKC